MRIIQGIGEPGPAAGVPASAPAPDLSRLEALEKIAASILQRLQTLEERVDALEAVPAHPPKPASTAAPVIRQETPAAPVSVSASALNAEAVRKGLLTRMWKYLHDEQRSPAA